MTSVMKRYPWSVLLRLTWFTAPLLVFYLFSRWSLAMAAGQPHRGDSGLGLAILLGGLTLMMLVGFTIDLAVQCSRRRGWNCAIDALLILLLLAPFGWFACNWFGGGELLVCMPPMRLFDTVIALLGM